MVSVRVVAFVALAALFSAAARAADMPQLPPVYAPPIAEASGWYLRGDIGMSNQKVRKLDNALFTSGTTVVHKDFDSAPIFGLGIGYQFNSWLRTDVTGEYRGKANFHGFDINNGTSTNDYRGSKSEWLALVNAYVDLGTWYSFTPFVGVGVGVSYNTISNFMDVNEVTTGVAYGDTASKWNFAWAAHAGVAYKVNSSLTLEFAYRYVSLGDAMSGDIKTYTGVNNVYNPMHFKDITSHDLRFGVRWLLEPPMKHDPIMLPPLMRRG